MHKDHHLVSNAIRYYYGTHEPYLTVGQLLDCVAYRYKLDLFAVPNAQLAECIEKYADSVEGKPCQPISSDSV